MDFKKVYFLIGVAIFMLAARQTMWAQELPVSTSAVEIMTNQPVSLEQEKDIKWAWGEVVNLDGQSGAVTLKYLDYETDQEKELVLFIDEKTTFENVVNFAELKLNDTLSIDYVVGSDNRNIAENISLENPEIVDQSVVLDLEQLPEPAVELAESPEPAVELAESPEPAVELAESPEPAVELAESPEEPAVESAESAGVELVD